jgi:predicted XRE-type DNA-binding protein
MKLRAELAHEIIEELKRKKLTQAKSAKKLNVTQPRISDLMRGRIDLFSLDALVDMAQLAGLQTKMTVKVRRAA